MRQVTTLPHQELNYGLPWNGTFGNYDTNRKPVTTVVLHSTAGTLSGSLSRLQDPKSNVSCNYIINTDGALYSMVPEDKVAYHSGNYAINQQSIGIEFVDNGNGQAPRPDALYKTGAALLADLSKEYSLPLDETHFRLHREITATQCPTELSRDRLLTEAKQLFASPPATFVEVESSVFTNLVLESTEYDAIWLALGIDESLKKRVGSHNVILDILTERISQARNAGNVSNVPPVVATPTVTQSTPSKQSVSLWRTDVKDLLNQIFSAVKRT